MNFPVLLFGSIHPHPIFELLAYAIGFQLFQYLRRTRSEPFGTEQRLLLLVITVAGAFVGAKVLAWLVDPAAVWAGRGDWYTWMEGKTIVGGLLGGTIAVELAKRRMGITHSTGDLYAVPLALGIAIGRIGCFLTGLPDRTYGIATGSSWGVDFGDGVLRHPTQLYEIGFLLVLAAVLWRRMDTPHANGDQFKLFLVGYMAWRFLVGFIQPAPTLLGLATIQWAALATLLVYSRHIPRLLALRPTPEPTP